MCTASHVLARGAERGAAGKHCSRSSHTSNLVGNPPVGVCGSIRQVVFVKKKCANFPDCIPNTGGVPGSQPARCRPEAPVRSRFAGKREDAAACTNQAGARYALCMLLQLRAGHAERSEEPNALLGWVGGNCHAVLAIKKKKVGRNALGGWLKSAFIPIYGG
jgi:hypothetical protein